MPLVSKNGSVVGSRQQSIMGQARVIDDAMRLKREPIPVQPVETPRKVGRPPGTKIINGKLVYPVERDGVALRSAAHPSPPEDVSEDAIETVEIELPEDTYEIFKQLDKPSWRPKRQSKPLRTMLALNPGQAFFIPHSDLGKASTVSTASTLRSGARRHGMFISVVQNFRHPVTGKLGIGVWRTK